MELNRDAELLRGSGGGEEFRVQREEEAPKGAN